MIKLIKRKDFSLKAKSLKGYAAFSCVLTFSMLILGIALREIGYITEHCWIILIAAIYNLSNLLCFSKEYYNIVPGIPEYLHDGTPNSKIVIEWKIFFLIVIPGILLHIWMYIFYCSIYTVDLPSYAFHESGTFPAACQTIIALALFINLSMHFNYDDVTVGKDILLKILCAICSLVISLSLITYGNWCFAETIQTKAIVIEKTISHKVFSKYRVLTDLGSDPYFVNYKEFNAIEIGDTVVVVQKKGVFREEAFYIKR